MKTYPWKDKQWLEEQMKIHGSGKAIARATGYPETNIQRYLKRYGLNRPQKLSKCSDKEWLIEQYRQGKTIREIAKLAGSSTRTVLEYNEKYGINPKELNPDYQKDYYSKEWLEEQLEKHGSGLAIARATGYPANSINRWINHYGLMERKYTTKQKVNLNEHYFDIIDTEEKAYWLGFMMADGYMYERKNPVGSPYTLSIKLKSTDKEHLEKFAKAIEYDGNIKIIRQKRKETWTEQAEIRINSIHMCKMLIGHGIVPRKSGKEHISSSVPSHLIPHFIRGYLDGDGSISIVNHDKQIARISICSLSFDMLRQIQQELNSYGISSCLYDYRNKNKVSIISINARNDIIAAILYLYENATVYLDRKYEIAKKIMSLEKFVRIKSGELLETP